MKTSIEAKNLIKQHEGLVLDTYSTNLGNGKVDKPTIGWGHTGAGVKLGKITEKQAQQYFDYDIVNVENIIKRHVKTYLLQCQFDALVSFVFNLGEGNFKKSTLLKLINQQKHEEASEQFERWIFAQKQKLKGLIRRREDEKNLFLKNKLPLLEPDNKDDEYWYLRTPVFYNYYRSGQLVSQDTVQDGFRNNLASLPELIEIICEPHNPDILIASIVHDDLYTKKKVSRKDADLTWKYYAKGWKKHAGYAILRYCGGKYYYT